MENKLCGKLPYKIEHHGKLYKLRPYFNIVLQILEVQQQDWLTEQEKIEISLSRLVVGRLPKKIDDRINLLLAIYRLLFGDSENHSWLKVFDFAQDADYIYAAFMECYKIDLYEQQGKLHWNQFISLFSGLSEETRLMKIISIRAKPIPKRTKYNAEEISQLLKLKQQFALKVSDDERMRTYANGLKKIAAILGSMAKDEKN